jgi:hypothetical protein
MKPLLLALRCIAALSLAACGSGSESPAAANVATTGTQQFETSRLADLMGKSQVPLRDEDARAIAQLWIDYQLLATAAVTGDSLTDSAQVDDAIWVEVANARASRWYARVSPTWPLDSIDGEELYKAGSILMARQILIAVPAAAPPAQSRMIRMAVDSVRRSLTNENFAAQAKKLSADQASASLGGLMAPWPARRGVMVPEFEAGVAATPIGTISGLIPTSFGVHIVYRLTYAEAAGQVAALTRQLAAERAESTYFAELEQAADIRLVQDAPLLARMISQDMDAYADSTSVIATTKKGDFTAARLVRWVSAAPPEQGMQGRLRNASDSLVSLLLREIVRNDLFLQQADSAGITLTPAETDVYRRQLRTLVGSIMGTLGVAPAMLPDSIRKQGADVRQRFVSNRADAAVANMIARRIQVVEIPRSVRLLLRARYPAASISKDGLAAALEAARPIRQSADSARNAAAPLVAPGGPAPELAPPARALKPKA